MKKMMLILLSGLLILSGVEALATGDQPNGKWTSFLGVVEKVPVGLYGTWIVEGRSVVVSPHTRVEQNQGLAASGSHAKIMGVTKGGILYATTVQVEADGESSVGKTANHQHRNGSFLGKIRELPRALLGYWDIDGHRVLVDKLTRIEEALGRAVEGALVAVDGYYRNSTFYARKVQVQ